MEQKIYEKIQKLLNLSSSNFEGEANMALKKAYELMDQYNVSMVDIEGHSREQLLGPLGNYELNNGKLKKYYNWETKLLAIISSLFDCKVVSFKCGGGYKQKSLGIVGREGNAKTAELMFNWIDEKTRKEAHEWFKYERSTWKSYCLGVVIGVAETVEKLKAQKAAQVNAGERDLVVVDEVDNFMNQMFGKIPTSKSQCNISDREGYVKGLEEGKKISLNHQVSRDEETGNWLGIQDNQTKAIGYRAAE